VADPQAAQHGRPHAATVEGGYTAARGGSNRLLAATALLPGVLPSLAAGGQLPPKQSRSITALEGDVQRLQVHGALVLLGHLGLHLQAATRRLQQTAAAAI
jgi:hypothetical protein